MIVPCRHRSWSPRYSLGRLVGCPARAVHQLRHLLNLHYLWECRDLLIAQSLSLVWRKRTYEDHQLFLVPAVGSVCPVSYVTIRLFDVWLLECGRRMRRFLRERINAISLTPPFIHLPVHVTSHNWHLNEFPARFWFVTATEAAILVAASRFLCFWPSKCSR